MAIGYTTVQQAGLVAGAFTQVVNEATTPSKGDGTTVDFKTQSGFILNGSEKVFLDGVLQTVTTEYTIDDDTGVITFVTPPAATCTEITATYKFLPNKVSSDLTSYLDGTEAEINNLFNKVFDRTNGAVLLLDGDGKNQIFLLQENIPLLVVNTIEILDTLGNVARLLVAADFGFNNLGRIFLRQRIDTVLVYGFGTTTANLTATWPVGLQNVRVDIDYGFDSVPADIAELASILVAMRFLVEQMGGTFDDVTSYTMGSKTVGVGEPYVNIRATVERLEKRADRIIANRRRVNVA